MVFLRSYTHVAVTGFYMLLLLLVSSCASTSRNVAIQNTPAPRSENSSLLAFHFLGNYVAREIEFSNSDTGEKVRVDCENGLCLVPNITPGTWKISGGIPTPPKIASMVGFIVKTGNIAYHNMSNKESTQGLSCDEIHRRIGSWQNHDCQ